MKIEKYCLGIFFVLFLATVTVFAENEVGSWVSLFDGKTLKGWVKHGGKADYKVVDGTIIGTSRPNTPNTFLCTRREYADFVFEYEYYPHPTLNSGVQFRSKIREKGDRVFGYQCEIDPSDRKWSAGVFEEGARGWLYPVESEKAKAAYRPGEWNKVRIVCVGHQIRTYLNGVSISDLMDKGEAEGIIGLQVHGVGGNKEPMEIKWRNLRIKEITAEDTVELIEADQDTMGLPAPRGADILLAPGKGLEEWMLRPDKVPWMNLYKKGSLQWKVDVEKGIATPKPKAGSMDSKKKFGAQRIHVEFRTPFVPGETRPEVSGNSGVYIQGSYELQICNSAGLKPADNLCGGLYGQRVPDVNAARKPGEWQTYDICFIPAKFNKDGKKITNARLSAKLNGQWIHKNVEVTGPTGGGDKETASPRALRLQEHQNYVDFRNVWVSDVDNPCTLANYDPRRQPKKQ